MAGELPYRTPSAAHPSAPPVLWHHLLQGRRLYINAWIRYLVVAAIVVGSLFAVHVVGVKDLDVARLFLCAGILAVYNTVVMLYARPLCAPERAQLQVRPLMAISHVTITLDYLVLTYLIWLVGGAESPFLAFYLLHIVIAGVMMSRYAVYAHALFGYLLLAGLVIGEVLEWIPKHRPVGAVPAGGAIEIRYALTVLIVYGMLTVGAAFLTSNVAELLRQGERRLRAVNRELEQLSEVRRSFVHIALHDIKSPLATISTLLDNLSSEIAGPLTVQQKQWVDRAQVRFKDLLAFLRDLQTLAELEAGEIQKQAKRLDLPALLRQVCEGHREMAGRKKQTLRVETPAELPPVMGVARLIQEAVVNYVTNAIKYTDDGGTVVVRAIMGEQRVRVEVQDDGPGISPEDQERLFKEFVRILPKDGKPPKAGGTGLGLSIVKRIVESHGGQVGVESEPGKGATFYFELPSVEFVGSSLQPAV